jgi:hypothetical protein
MYSTVYEINLDKLKRKIRTRVHYTMYGINFLTSLEEEFAQECMYNTVYEINLDKLKEKSHKSAWIYCVWNKFFNKFRGNSHKSAGIVLCMR